MRITLPALVLLAISGASIPASSRSRRSVLRVATIVLSTIAAMLLPAAAARGASKEIKGYAHVSNNTTVSVAKEGSLPLNSVGTIGDIAGSVFAGTAQYQLYTTIGGGAQVSGQSNPVSYSQYLANGYTTQADGYMRITDYFTVLGLGPSIPSGPVNISARMFGALMPNNEFESQWNATHTSPIMTSWVTMNLTSGRTDGQGNFQGLPTRNQLAYDSSAEDDEFNLWGYQTQLADLDHRTFGFDLTIGGFGQMGGGFSLAGAGGSSSTGLASDGGLANLSAAAAPLDFFQIQVELPPGLSIGGQSALVNWTTIPEPSSLALLSVVVPALLRRRRSTRSACCETLEKRRLLSLAPAVNYPVGEVGASPQAVVAADFNNDGRLDLATANPGLHSVSVLLGNGNGGFGAAINSPGTTNDAFERASVTVADFNKDGKLDLATTMYGYYQDGLFGRLDVRLGNGNGTFQSPVLVRGGGPLAVAAGDFNNDGKSDVVYTADYDGQQTFTQVLFGNGLGGFVTSGSGVGSDYYTGLAVGDLNRDGNLDAVGYGDGPAVHVYPGNGRGGLAIGSYFDTASGALELAIADFTRDGIPDLVVSGGRVEIFTGRGDGTFGEPIVHSANGEEHPGLGVADFNGDGKFDVVTSDGDTGTVSLLLGNGDGTLRYIGAFAAGSSPSALAVGDFNGDGRPDVAAANSGSNNVSVLLNDGVWATKTWIGPSGSNWSTAGNWNPSGVPAASDQVIIDGGKSVILSSSATVNGITLAGGANLVVGASGNRVLRASKISIDATSSLDLKDNNLIFDYQGSSPLSDILALLARGRGSSPTGILSSTANASAGSLVLGVAEASKVFGISGGQSATFWGQTVDATTVLIKHTVKGDLNLDGGVSIADFITLSSNFGKTSAIYSDGDLNYDGAVTIADFIDLAARFNQSLASSAPAVESQPPAAESISIVPEDATNLLDSPTSSRRRPKARYATQPPPQRRIHHRLRRKFGVLV